jgi:hypothetical protein
MAAIDDGRDVTKLASEVNALAMYASKLEDASTWPYSHGMPRTLMFAVLAPLATVITRFLLDAYVR